MICKLKKTLYGLKQSPRAWFVRFAKTITSQGYRQCQDDHTLFVKFSFEKKIAILIVYFDDIILTGDYEEEIVKLRKLLAIEFEIKDLVLVRYFLGMEVAQSNKGIVICQRKYNLDMLNVTRMLGCEPIDTPMDPNKKAKKGEESPLMDKERNHSNLVLRIYSIIDNNPS